MLHTLESHVWGRGSEQSPSVWWSPSGARVLGVYIWVILRPRTTAFVFTGPAHTGALGPGRFTQPCLRDGRGEGASGLYSRWVASSQRALCRERAMTRLRRGEAGEGHQPPQPGSFPTPEGLPVWGILGMRGGM